MVLRKKTTDALTSHERGFMQRYPWIWPLVAAVMLAFVGLWIRVRMESAVSAQLASNLKTILEANVEALRNWASARKSHAEVLAGDEGVRAAVERLLQRVGAQGTSVAVLLSAPEVATLRTRLGPAAQAHGFDDYVVLSTNFTVLVAGRDHFLGMTSPPGFSGPFQACFAGQTMLTMPFPSLAPQPDAQGNWRAGIPTMFAIAPVRSAGGEVIAALGLRIVPEKDFTRILATARTGSSGETYAFNREGLLLSQSRFDEQLKQMGLLPDKAEARSILNLELRDPQTELGPGQPSPKRSQLGLTKAVSEAIAGRTGFDVQGYHDYRGVRVVGAWTWLPDFDFGLVTELDAAEAFGPGRVIRQGFLVMFAMLAATSVIVFLLMQVAGRWKLKAYLAAKTAQQLGQYTLDKEIGSGGFGTVFHAHHALMRRPVAVKVLNPLANEAFVARFEREVQLTCQLTHPNTIAIYDYGRTPDGLFYYAMEYLDGLSLSQLIKQYGPQPEARVIHILRQICASLTEAHAQGLVHRDIKPQNIFLTRRGGIPDFVKVLDFGLVKARNLPGELELTAPNAVLGTPLYMSPEAIQSPSAVDGLSDLYALGAVGFVLLTGTTVFEGESIGQIFMQQLRAMPDKPSVRLKHPVSPDLENLILQCLAKLPADRPANAAALEAALGRCAASGDWSRQAAEQWWHDHLGANPQSAAAAGDN